MGGGRGGRYLLARDEGQSEVGVGWRLACFGDMPHVLREFRSFEESGGWVEDEGLVELNVSVNVLIN